MSLTPSTMLPIGTKAPDFILPDPTGKQIALSDFSEAPATFIIFMCNHCPYVKHLQKQLTEIAREFQDKGVAVIAINSNDTENYTDDSPKEMAKEIKKFDYTFPYLFDETQEIAKAYRAACTPDFYVFDGDQKLAYRGQFDASRPGNSLPINGADIKNALNSILNGEPVSTDQKPSIGCSIKWRPGNAPEYFGNY